MRFKFYANFIVLPRVLITLVFLLLWQGYAQNLIIFKPDDKQVSPGDYVTLVFRLQSSEDLSVTLSATSNWPILRQPEELNLEANKARPLALTLAVPATARAGFHETLELSARSQGQSFSSSVTLRVNEFKHLELDVDQAFTLGSEDLELKIINKGNVQERLQILGTLEGNRVFEQNLELEPFSQKSLYLQPNDEGLYVFDLLQATEILTSAFVEVNRIGTADLKPLELASTTSTFLNSNLSWQTHIFLQGSLSDFSQLDSSLSLPNWENSYAQVSSKELTARMGEVGQKPFGLNLQNNFGLSARWSPSYNNNTNLAAGFGWLKDDQFSAYLAGQYKDSQTTFAAGTGIQAGQISSDLKLLIAFSDVNLQGRLSLLDTQLNFETKADFISSARTNSYELSARHLLSDKALYQASFTQTQDNIGEFQAGISLANVDLPLNAHIGSSIHLSSSLVGMYNLDFQIGSQNSFVALEQTGFLDTGWQTRNRFAVSFDHLGVSYNLDSTWLTTINDRLSLSGHIFYRPDTDLFDAQLEANGELELEPWPLSVDANVNWGLLSQHLNVASSLNYDQDQWQLYLSNNLAYDYSVGHWYTQLGLRANYSFSSPVPEAISNALGGRNLGQLHVQVLAHGEAIAGVEVKVGRFRFLTDETGSFHADLSPGDYQLKLEPSSLPVTYYLLSEVEQTLSVKFQELTSLTLEATFATSIVGSVLEDDDADGIVSSNARGVDALLVLTDSTGFKRQISTNSEGKFSISRLKPGAFSLKLITLPQGSSPVTDVEQHFVAEAKEQTELVFLVQPASAKGTNFSQSSLRIRRANFEMDTVPAGTAPLLSVSLSEAADAVRVDSDYGSFTLEKREESWQGRFQIPLNAAPGIAAITIVAQKGDSETNRTLKLLIDPNAAAFELGIHHPVRPGEDLFIDLYTWLYPVSPRLESDFGSAIFESSGEGKFQARLAIPQDTHDGIYNLRLALETPEQTLIIDETFRVLVTD